MLRRLLLVPGTPRPLFLKLPMLAMLALFASLEVLPSPSPPPTAASAAASMSRIANWAMVLILRETQEARILPRCFSPSRDRGKSPLLTNATMSTII